MDTTSQRDEIDERIRLELARHLDSLPVEGEEDGWLRVKQEVYSPEKRVASRTRLRRLAIAAVFLIAILITLRAPSVRAWSRDVLSSWLVKMPGPLRNIVTVFIPQSPAESQGRPDPVKQMETLFSSISFRPMVLGEDAGRWLLKSVGVATADTGTKVTLEYMDGEGAILTLEEEPVLGPASSATFFDADDTVVTDVTIRGTQISILYHKSGQVNVWWMEQDLALYLNAQMDASAAEDFIGRLVICPGGR